MQPGNPVVGGTVLRRVAIQSPNYVAGTSGWAVFQDGTAEFNSATFRGTVQVGTSSGQTIIDTTIPAILSSLYSPMGTVGFANIRMSPADTSYYYQLVGIRSSGPGSFYAAGWVPAGATLTSQVRQFEFKFYDTTSNIEQTNLLDSSHDSRLLIEANFVRIGDALSGNTEIDGTLSVFNQTTIAGTAGQDVFQIGRKTDTNNRFIVDADGNVFAGPGGVVAVDTRLSRVAAGVWISDTIKKNIAGAAETWHGLALLNNFTNRGAGFPALSYRQVASPAGDVEVAGQIVSGVTVASGTAVANLAAGVRPVTEMMLRAVNGSALGNAVDMSVATTGDLILFGTWANGNVIKIGPTAFPTDL